MPVLMADGLTAHQREVAERILAEEDRRCRHLVVALSGAHAYGFPSSDSDLDLKAVHIVPARDLLGMAVPETHASRLEVIDGVEIDYSSNELAGVLAGILQGNGNYVERVLGSLLLRSSPALAELRPLVRGALSQRLYRHYAGFAQRQLHELEEAELPTVKRLLYVLRTALTGAHLLRTGEVVTDLGAIAESYGFGAARELIAAKLAGERSPFEPSRLDLWRPEARRALELLETARLQSILPAEPPAESARALEEWLIALRAAELVRS
jgi:predicted nucleotidyltransferase